MEVQLWGESQTQITGSGLTLGWLALLVSRAKGDFGGWSHASQRLAGGEIPAEVSIFRSMCPAPFISDAELCVSDSECHSENTCFQVEHLHIRASWGNCPHQSRQHHLTQGVVMACAESICWELGRMLCL